MKFNDLADPSQDPERYETLVHSAAVFATATRQFPVLTVLLRDFSTVVDEENTPCLYCASCKPPVPIGMQPDLHYAAVDHWPTTSCPLIHATAISGDIEMAQWLIEQGCNPARRNKVSPHC